MSELVCQNCGHHLAEHQPAVIYMGVPLDRKCGCGCSNFKRGPIGEMDDANVDSRDRVELEADTRAEHEGMWG